MSTDGARMLDAYRAMETDHPREARRLLDAHLSGVDGMRMFTDACIERQLTVASRPLSTLVVVGMRPADFLSLAVPMYREADLPEGSLAPLVDDGKLASIAAGLASEGLDNLPFLRLDPEGEDARVVMHEGRHRAMTAMSLGIRLMPVQLILPGDGRHPDDGVWHLMPGPPCHLLGERGRDGGPGNERTRVPTPAVPLGRHLTGLDDEEADAIVRVLRTANRVANGFDPDDGECADTREWAEAAGQYTLRWMEPTERLESALEHLAGYRAGLTP